jgi:ABC-type antimicrobial peptide transport system permease subunit
VNSIKDSLPDYLISDISFKTESYTTLYLVDGIVSLLFDLVIIITMFLCFFSLSSSMSANLLEQAKEIGVLRAIGFRKVRIVMLYIYEAFILVLASSLMGILVGVGVGWSMTV